MRERHHPRHRTHVHLRTLRTTHRRCRSVVDGSEEVGGILLIAKADTGIVQVVVCGAVDDGKSTLIGRLLVETRSIPEDEKNNLPVMDFGTDYSRLTDGLVAEAEQGITIDVAHRYLRLADGTRVLLADSPGHHQYTRNMAVAAARADVALVVVDAAIGVRDQTIRHVIVCHLMGVRAFIFALNKMDLVAHEADRAAVEQRIHDDIIRQVPQLTRKTISPDITPTMMFVPVSARDGSGVSTRSEAGRDKTLIQALSEAVHRVSTDVEGGIARLPVQMVLRESGERHYAGRVAGGDITVGETLTVWPSRQTVTVKGILDAGRNADIARRGRSVTLSFIEDTDVARGDIISQKSQDDSPQPAHSYTAEIVWIDDMPLDIETSYLVRVGPTTAPAAISSIDFVHQVSDRHGRAHAVIGCNDIARVTVTFNAPVLLDPYLNSRSTGGFILCDRRTGDTVAAGMTLAPVADRMMIAPHEFTVTRAMREELNGVRAGVVWLTGLSGAGKSTLADALDVMLLQSGIRSFVLDGDALRRTLNDDLDFSPAGRAESVRRAGRMAQILVDAGIVVIVALVSPFAEDRKRVRDMFHEGDFVEVFVDTPLNVCEVRDPKGLYTDARSRSDNQMTGVGQVYEPPASCEFHLDGTAPVQDNAAALRDWVLARHLGQRPGSLVAERSVRGH